MTDTSLTADEAITGSAPVLIVGGSLVGLSAAVFLAWRGVPVVVAEKHAGSSLHPGAIGYTTRTLELFRATGIEVPETPESTRPPRRARVESLAGTWYEEYPWTPGGGGQQAVEYSPAHPTAIAQDRLEPILRRRAVELGAEVRLRTELARFTQDDAGVTAVLRQRDDGGQYRLRAQYMVAADGAGSGVRDALGIGRHGAAPGTQDDRAHRHPHRADHHRPLGAGCADRRPLLLGPGVPGW